MMISSQITGDGPEDALVIGANFRSSVLLIDSSAFSLSSKRLYSSSAKANSTISRLSVLIFMVACVKDSCARLPHIVLSGGAGGFGGVCVVGRRDI
jgi:hypothetical protein